MSYNVILCPKFVSEGKAGLNFCAHCALSIDEVDEISQKINEARHKLKLLSTHRCGAEGRQVRTKVLQSWVIPEIHHIGSEDSSFRSLYFHCTYSFLIKVTKAMQLHTYLPVIYQIHRKIMNKKAAKYQYIDYIKRIQTIPRKVVEELV